LDKKNNLLVASSMKKETEIIEFEQKIIENDSQMNQIELEQFDVLKLISTERQRKLIEQQKELMSKNKKFLINLKKLFWKDNTLFSIRIKNLKK
jgi:hypothetical protein